MKTRKIANHNITLTAGRAFLATRQIADGFQKEFPVTISDIDTGKTVDIIAGLTWAEANKLINAFNNGRTSFEGRVW